MRLTLLSVVLLLAVGAGCGLAEVNLIAYERYIGTGSNREIWTIRPDGSNPMQLTSGYNDHLPVWSPDGTQLAISPGGDPYGTSVARVNADGSNRTTLATGTSLLGGWGPGSKIMYGKDTWSEPPQLWMMDGDGSNQTKLLDWAFPGCLSPDGSKFAYTQIAGAYESLYVRDLSGSGYGTPLVSSWVNALNPIWSPDGTKLAFNGNTGGSTGNDIYAINTDGTGLTQLTSTSEPDQRPTWAPDGTKIAFMREMSPVTGNWDLWVMGADGTGQVNITNTPDIGEAHPSWQPGSTPVPEVPTYALAALGALALGLVRLRRRGT